MASEILVVDDNLDIRKLISGILRDQGMIVREAANFDQALLEINKNTQVTRFRNYINSKYAEFAIRNNSTGNFLSIGISYGTSLKIITHLLDEKVAAELICE